MDNKMDNKKSVYKENDARHRDETPNGRKSEREIESDNEQDKAVRNGEGLTKPQEGVGDSPGENETEDEEEEESVYDTEDEKTEDEKDKESGKGL